MRTTPLSNAHLPPRVRLLRSATWSLLIGEWLLGISWPPICLALLYFSFALIGGLEALPREWQLLLALAVLLGMCGLIIWRLARLLPPQRERIDQRLMLTARLRINPFAALEDRPAQAMATAHQLWQVAAAQQKNLWPRLQRPKLRPLLLLQDPRALRYLATLLFGVAYVCAGSHALDRLYLAAQPGALQSVGALLAAPQFTITLTPPAYSLQGVRVLDSAPEKNAEPLLIPQGTTVQAHVQGGLLKPRLAINGGRVSFVPDGNGFAIEGTVQSGNYLALRQGWREIARWPIKVATAQPPLITMNTPETLSKGRFVIRWQAKDVFGLQKIELKMNNNLQSILWSAQSAPQAEMTQTSQLDWSASRLAGTKVMLSMIATNTADKVAETAPIEFMLPEREFTQAQARALATARKMLWQQGMNALPAIQTMLNDIIKIPLVRKDTQAYLALQSTLQALPHLVALDDAASQRITDTFWRVALRLEEGNAADIQQNLQSAADALANGLQDKQADANRIEQLMQRYEEALQNYLAHAQPHSAQKPAENAEIWDEKRLQQELQLLKESFQAGSKKEALARLQQLQSVLQNMQGDTGKPQSQTSSSKTKIRLDPFGRPVGQGALDQHSGVAVSLDADTRQAGRKILNELRDRANAPSADPQTADYYQRLLQLND